MGPYGECSHGSICAGVVVRHRQLEGNNWRLMLVYGVHLNDIWLDIFLSGLQDGVDQAMFLLGGGKNGVVRKKVISLQSNVGLRTSFVSGGFWCTYSLHFCYADFTWGRDGE